MNELKPFKFQDNISFDSSLTNSIKKKQFST